MKYLLPIAVFSVSLITLSFATNKQTKPLANDENGFALVELFTSEGCSSCPAADVIVEEVQKEYGHKNVLILGYHVDYWDRLGWKDVYSNAVFTKRQEYYAGIFRLNSIYTPQIVVNGKAEFVGSNKSRLTGNIDEQLNEKPVATIKLKALQNTSGKIDVNYSTEGADAAKEQAVLTLIQKKATSEIKRGENKGRTLHHINIVRYVFYMPLKESATSFTLPDGFDKSDFFIAGFIQEKRTGKIKALQSIVIQ